MRLGTSIMNVLTILISAGPTSKPSARDTWLTDLPLTQSGARNAERLRGLSASKVFTSPLQRGARTCELACFGIVAEIDYSLGRCSICGRMPARRTIGRSTFPGYLRDRWLRRSGVGRAMADARVDKV